MALADILVRKGNVSLRTCQTEAGATAIKAGEPVKLKSSGSPYVIPLATNEPVIGTTTEVIGVAASNSTHTASANGTINVYVPDNRTEWETSPTTLTNADTQSEIDALVNDRVLLQLTAGVYTLDENGGDTATSGVEITGGDAARGKIYFKFRTGAIQGPTS